MKKTIRYIGGIVTAAALAAAAAWWLSLPAPEDQHRCMAMIEQQRCALLSVGTLSMPLISNIDDRDTTRPYRNFDTWTPAYTDTIYTPAVWVNRWALLPSCHGSLATPIARPIYGGDSTATALHLRRELALYEDMLHYYRGDEESGYTLKRNIDEQRRETANLKYYLRVHGVQDEGYHDITRYYRRQDRQLQRLLSLQRDTKRQTAIITQRISILRKALANLSGAKFTTQARYEAIVKEGKQRQRYPLHAVAERSRQGYLLLQRTDSITPDSARAVSMVAWPRMLDEEALVTTYRDLYARHVIRDNRLNISRRLGITPIGPLPAGYTGYWLSRQDNGSVTAGYRVKGRRQGEGLIFCPDSVELWGRFNADTLCYGISRHRTDWYRGDMDRRGRPHGHGTLCYDGCRTYCGSWKAGHREGFGYQTGLNTALQAGEWESGNYRGERLTYTSDRIYGIDISRFQHEKGKKKFGIDWQRLRISHLGTSSRKRINGHVDYPISFMYIKATEGISIRNRYYAADYRQARSHNIHVGSYHFFSTTTPGAAQARHFLRHARLSKGDLPPVLDIEPSTAQIKRMGGPEALWREVRAWLRVVRQRSGVAPVLYISQMFVNTYLPYAPDVRSNHPVWIARYGEYKPDVRLAYWQLCADGRVNGIRGEVDINVFNGYKDEFRLFLEQNCIR